MKKLSEMVVWSVSFIYRDFSVQSVKLALIEKNRFNKRYHVLILPNEDYASSPRHIFDLLILYTGCTKAKLDTLNSLCGLNLGSNSYSWGGPEERTFGPD